MATGTTATNDLLHAQPLYVPPGMVGVALRIGVHARASNGSVQSYAAVYSDSAQYPNARVAVSTEDTGVTANTFNMYSFTWTPSAEGLYWMAWICSSVANPTLTQYAPGRYVSAFGTTATTPNYGLAVAYAYGQPPSTFPAGAGHQTQPPILFWSRD